MSRSRFLPETDPAQIAPFVASPAETRTLLVALFERGLPLWVFPTGGTDDDYVVSQLLAVDATRMELEIGPDRRWARVLSAPSIEIVAFLERVKLQLGADVRGSVDVDGEQRLLVTRTGDVHRLQRRDGFRLRMPLEEPAICHVREPDGTRAAYRVLDVSVVGLAIAFPPHLPAPELGRRFRGVRLQLPQELLLPCELTVRQVAEEPDPETGAVRVGCSYDPMPPEVARALQRAILDLERRYLPGSA